MKRNLLVLVAVLAIGAPAVCRAAGSPWDGTWKLNQSKSKMTGDVFTLAALPNGGFHLSTPSHSLDRDYTCDGKDYPVFAERTGTCKKVDDTHYEMAGKTAGKPEWHGSSVVSPDARYLTNTAYLRRPDGSETTEINRYERVGTGTGRAGTWRNVKSFESLPDITKITVNGDIMRTESPAYKMVVTAKLDGSLARLEGPNVPSTMTLRVKAEAPTKVHYFQTMDSKPMAEGTQTLSADGRTMIEEKWEPGSPGEKQTYVYEKQ